MGRYVEIISQIRTWGWHLLIFITLGTQKFQMNRLIEAADKLALHIEEEIYIQTGNSTYEPKNCQYSNFLDGTKFKEMIEACSILITHAGVGSIMTGIQAGKPIIVVPRLSEFQEHVDDHQIEIADAFEKKKCVLCCNNLDELERYINSARKFKFESLSTKGGNIEQIVLDFIKVFDE